MLNKVRPTTFCYWSGIFLVSGIDYIKTINVPLGTIVVILSAILFFIGRSREFNLTR